MRQEFVKTRIRCFKRANFMAVEDGNYTLLKRGTAVFLVLMVAVIEDRDEVTGSARLQTDS